MPRGIVDYEGLASARVQALRDHGRPDGHPFKVTKLGHAVLRVSDLERSVTFYTDVLGFEVSDAYPATMMPGGMVFLRFSPDHHGIALIGEATHRSGDASGLHHMAFEVATLDEVIRARDHLLANGVQLTFEGRRRAGCQVAIEFDDPDGHALEIYWGLDQVGSDGVSRPPDQWREAQSLAEAVANPPSGQDTTLGDHALKP